MTGGLIQLVAYGVEDVFLTQDPQITYFKVVYRRHTNFSIEMVPQSFTHKGNFGKKVSATISRAGDLAHRMFIRVTLPKVPQFTTDNGSLDPITKFAWVRRVAFALIKSVEIEIGGEVIDRHYGDWMNIWYELATKQTRGLQKMLGQVPEVEDYTNGKEAYTLTIPLHFWFCQSPGLAIPLISLQHSEVRVNVEFNDLEKCRNLGPTHYIRLDNDVCNLEPHEYLCQEVNQRVTIGEFMYYDVVDKKMYYNKISGSGFQGLTYNGLLDDTQIKTLVRDDTYRPYLIHGLTSSREVMPGINEVERLVTRRSMRPISLRDATLWVEYLFLDNDERVRFSQEKHEYLIKQLQYTGSKTIDTSSRNLRLGFQHPCAEIYWVLQQQAAIDRNDHFNYTDSYRWENGLPTGNNNTIRGTLMINDLPRLPESSGDYYSWTQAYQHHRRSPMTGINSYAFSLQPEKLQPDGSCNMSKVDNFNLLLVTNTQTNFTQTSQFRGYATNYNVLRVAHGLSGLVFVDWSGG